MNLPAITAYVNEATAAITGLAQTEHGLHILLGIEGLPPADHQHIEHEQSQIVQQRELLMTVIQIAHDLLAAMQALLDNGYAMMPIERVNARFLHLITQELAALRAAQSLFRPEGATSVTSSVGPERPSPPRIPQMGAVAVTSSVGPERPTR